MYSYIYYLVNFSFKGEQPFSTDYGNFIVQADNIIDAINISELQAISWLYENVKIISAEKIDCIGYIPKPPKQ